MPALDIRLVQEAGIEPGDVWQLTRGGIRKKPGVAKIHHLRPAHQALDAGENSAIIAPRETLRIQAIRQRIDIHTESGADIGGSRYVDDGLIEITINYSRGVFHKMFQNSTIYNVYLPNFLAGKLVPNLGREFFKLSGHVSLLPLLFIEAVLLASFIILTRPQASEIAAKNHP
jgi:hypothetical protein